MTSRRPILLLANPTSGGKPGAPQALADDPEALEPANLVAELRARRIEAELHVLREVDDPSALAAQAASDGLDVVAAGGDGTVGPVAAALCGTDAALGILATGSWNNLARSLGVPDRLAPALDVIARGRSSRVDAGLAWHPAPDAAGGAVPDDALRFFEAAGVGLDAAGFGAAELRERRGAWPALRSAWRAMRRRDTPMRIVLDGEARQTVAPALTVCNGPYMGMGFAIAPDADPADGLLNVVVFSRMSRWEVVRHFISVARRRPQPDPRVTRLQARLVTVSGVGRVLPAHVDGRSIGTTPVAFSVDPGALRVFR